MSSSHPYAGAPAYRFWKSDPGIADPALFDPVTRVGFTIAKEEPVVTAGSCFAQHVSRHLARNGFRFLITEPSHPMFTAALADKYNYGAFTARYGNVYTARQLRQLLERAFGLFQPAQSSWTSKTGTVVDPFRPQIQPNGFASEVELLLDREHHLAAVRTAIDTMAVFVFTLGLTEAWTDKADGAVYPLAPGVAGGSYDPDRHAFVNFGVDEIVADMRWSLDFIRARNPGVKFILTVSPVPLNATALDRHVAVSTAYSKAVLRVAAEQVCSSYELCDYFPSYEIITSAVTAGRYYAADKRNVTEAGVNHVMSLVLKHYGGEAGGERPAEPDSAAAAAERARQQVREMEKVVDVLCDEELITASA